MTLTTTVVGLSLVLEDTDLAFLTLFKNLAGYLGASYVGLTDLYVISGYEKNFVECYFCAFFNVQFFDGNNLTFFNNVLFSTCFDNCVHLCTSSLLYSPMQAAFLHFREPYSCGCVMALMYNDLTIIQKEMGNVNSWILKFLSLTGLWARGLWIDAFGGK